MRFLVDAQLPPALASYFESLGHEAKSVRDVGLRDATDPEIWAFARKGGWVLLTKDEDFARRVLHDEEGPSVVWLRIGNSTKRVLLGWISPLVGGMIRELEGGNRLIELQRPDGP